MISRDYVISDAIEKCLKELYVYAQPKVTWEEFKKENEIYNNKYKTWENFNKVFQEKDKNPEMWLQYQSTFRGWENKSITECIGPKPFEFYYLPKDIMKDICDSYIHAYKLDDQQELLNIIHILKEYCKRPVISKYIQEKDGNPGYRGYEHPDNLEKEINTYLDLKFPLMDPERAEDAEDFENKLNTAAKELQDKFFEFLDMAGNFYNWNGDLNSFNMSIYLGASPSSNMQTVIDNWKKYRNIDIEINVEELEKSYYD